MTSIRADELTLGYGRKTVVEGLTLDVPDGATTVIIGGNGSGKSTLLLALGRLLVPSRGRVLLAGADIQRSPTREIARRLALLPQQPRTPEAMTVRQLVALGRHPYQSWLAQWSQRDERMVERAMQRADVADLADRVVDTLSGGQRQRVWIALAVAQDTPLLLLDEPISFLDPAHQLDVLDLLRTLNRETRKTVVMVLHDLNLAARYGDHIIGMRDGRIVAEGTPETVMTADNVRAIFDLVCRIVPDPCVGTPMCVPVGRAL
ncbi:ABC transporter ATP-binding protein [Salinisphaera sp. Q1T1-3]|uniref:ABC transporter ATP-binding protein n=1 Tax=Salinisphaera sp. Q1T1-3 TaxID=2321229 RepID=UPI000E736504|nr:ABC transporter ATP-binding protein [Salinisphaera sp. Q1T1-3]RJS94400.1 ABC transporter ATP-binding protein [Salinisphaera sp. Q1T1-3]